MEKRKSEFRNEILADKIFDIINWIIVALVLVIICYPLYFILIASFSDPNLVANGDVILIPKGLSLGSYAKTFQYGDIWSGYANSLINTFFGTIISVTVTVAAAYSLSRKEMPGCGLFMKLITFTMFFSGGLIPTYLIVQGLGLYNTRAILLLISAVSAYNLIIARSFMVSNIPEELHEAAVLDGCDEFKFFFQVAIPISKALLSVMILLYAVSQWNSYFNALVYIKDRSLYPLQVILRELLIQTESSANMVGGNAASIAEARRIANMMKYSVIIVSSLPLLIAYSFVQKYFEKGIMIGAIKG